MAESVDALDLKSNRGSPSVPVQVWPGAIITKACLLAGLCLLPQTLGIFLKSLVCQTSSPRNKRQRSHVKAETYISAITCCALTSLVALLGSVWPGASYKRLTGRQVFFYCTDAMNFYKNIGNGVCRILQERLQFCVMNSF